MIQKRVKVAMAGSQTLKLCKTCALELLHGLHVLGMGYSVGVCRDGECEGKSHHPLDRPDLDLDSAEEE